MKHSTERILTTHTGNLPRPAELQELLYARERGEPFDQAIFEEKVRSAVRATVRQQVAVGVDVINDGEMSKISYATYVKHRLTGFSPVDAPLMSMWADLEEIPAYAQRLWQPGEIIRDCGCLYWSGELRGSGGSATRYRQSQGRLA